MAILRGGRRIGGFDIRLGIPRDKSLNDVQGDKRLGRTMGPNTESFIGRVMATIAEGEGFARPTRFMCDFVLPAGARFSAFGQNDEEINEDLVLKSLEIVQMKDWLNNTKNGLETIIGENGKMVSGGERQRIGIARTLYYQTEFILLDEPTSSLDMETSKKIIDILEKLENKTIILISHQKNNLSICNKVYEMKNGKLILDEKNKN